MPKQKPFDYLADIGAGKRKPKVGTRKKARKSRKMYFHAPSTKKRSGHKRARKS